MKNARRALRFIKAEAAKCKIELRRSVQKLKRVNESVTMP
jgi:hypothetical protein